MSLPFLSWKALWFIQLLLLPHLFSCYKKDELHAAVVSGSSGSFPSRSSVTMSEATSAPSVATPSVPSTPVWSSLWWMIIWWWLFIRYKFKTWFRRLRSQGRVLTVRSTTEGWLLLVISTIHLWHINIVFAFAITLYRVFKFSSIFSFSLKVAFSWINWFSSFSMEMPEIEHGSPQFCQIKSLDPSGALYAVCAAWLETRQALFLFSLGPVQLRHNAINATPVYSHNAPKLA